MKKMMVLLMTSMLALPALAQMAGLPVAEDAGIRNPGQMQVSGGIVLGDDINLYGGRLTYGMSPELAVFADFGLLDPDHGDTGWGIQGGGLFALPIADLPFDLAARATLGYASLDQDFGPATVDVDIITVNVGGLISMPVEMVTLYGYLGLNWARTEVSFRGFSESDTDTDPALGAGVLFPATPQLSFYGEVMHIDDLWFGLGARFAF